MASRGLKRKKSQRQRSMGAGRGDPAVACSRNQLPTPLPVFKILKSLSHFNASTSSKLHGINNIELNYLGRKHNGRPTGQTHYKGG